MKPRLLTAMLMFISSYAPLMVILSARDFDYEKLAFKHPDIVYYGLSVSVFSCLILWIATKRFTGGEQAKVISVENRSVELLNYTIPYLISFIPLKIGDPAELTAFGLFMALMFLITYKTDNLYINPVLTILGYKLYRVKLDISQQALEVNALVLSELKAGDRLFMERVAPYLYIQSTREGS